jgi:hypothetical protein
MYFLRNNTARDVIAYAISFHVQPLHGSSETLYLVAERTPRLLDAIDGDLSELPAGSERLVTPWFRWSKSKWAQHPDTAKYESFSRFRFVEELPNAKSVEVDLDAVIFDDGRLEGADTSGLGLRFACRRLGVKQGAVEFAALLASSASGEEVQQQLHQDAVTGQSVDGTSDPTSLQAEGRGILASEVLELLSKRPRRELSMSLRKVAFASRLKLTKVVRPDQNTGSGNAGSAALNP